MENRFGIKDLFLFLLIGLLVILVSLSMIQVNRQWNLVLQTSDRLNEQTRDLEEIKLRLRAGGGAGVAASQPYSQNLDADLVARANHAKPDYAPGGTIVDVLASAINRLTPVLDGDLYGYRVQSYVLDTLLDRDPNTLKWLPRLAKSWNVSSDGLVITFELRPGVVFSNGDPLTADDVKFTIDLTMNPEIEAPATRSMLDKLDHVEVTSEIGVKFVFKEPYYHSLETAAATQVLSRKFYSQFPPKVFNTTPGLLLGSGPYRMADPKNWKPEPGKPTEIVRNERYWGEPPGPDRIVWKLIEEPAARMIALKNGEIDVFSDINAVQFDEVKKDPLLSSKTRTLAMVSLNAGYLYCGWNQKRDGKPTRFADVRVRRAMTMLIDRDAMIRDIFRGYATPISSPFLPISPMADPSIKPLPFNPASAEKLLSEAGYHKQNGTLIDANGQPFKFKLTFTSGSETGKRIAQFIQNSLSQAGIICDPMPTDWKEVEQQQKERSFDAMAAGWGGGGAEDDPNQIFTSEAAKGVGNNFVQNLDPELDKAIEAARVTLDDAKRMELWHVVHRRIHEDQPYTFIAADWEMLAYANRYEGVGPTKLGVTPKNEWYVPKSAKPKQ